MKNNLIKQQSNQTNQYFEQHYNSVNVTIADQGLREELQQIKSDQKRIVEECFKGFGEVERSTGTIHKVIEDMMMALKEHEQNISKVNRWQDMAEVKFQELSREIQILRREQERDTEKFQVMRLQFGETSTICNEAEKRIEKLYHEVKEIVESIGEMKFGRNLGQDAETWSRIELLEIDIHHKWKAYEIEANRKLDEIAQSIPRDGSVRDATMKIEVRKIGQHLDAVELDKKGKLGTHKEN